MRSYEKLVKTYKLVDDLGEVLFSGGKFERDLAGISESVDYPIVVFEGQVDGKVDVIFFSGICFDPEYWKEHGWYNGETT